jgi:acetyl esterase/lipase
MTWLMRAAFPGCFVLLFALTPAAFAVDVWKEDPFMGDYQGDWAPGVKIRRRGLVAQVVPRGDDKYVIHLLPEFDQRCAPVAEIEARVEKESLVYDAGPWSGRIEDAKLTGQGLANGKSAPYELQRVHRLVPQLGAAPPPGAVILFDGSGFEHWTGIGQGGSAEDVAWKLVDGAMEVAPALEGHGSASSIGTKTTFQDYHLHIEFRLPLFPDVTGQSRGNSGIVFEDYTFHELQVLDSYGLPGHYDECGAIYKISAPHVNMCRPPLQWQSYDVIYRGPRYAADGTLSQAARITVNHNGKLIQKDLQLPDSPHAERQRREKPDSRSVGRIKLQNHGDPVQYRNIWLKELSPEQQADVASAQKLTLDIPYVENGHERQALDIYAPEAVVDATLPVMFWIHGGGWQVGDKSDVALKPKALTERGFVFVATNYRLLPDVEMDVLIRDVAKSLAWVHRNIAHYGGDPKRIFVGGHSAGAQLAALICIDDRYLREEGVPFGVLRGCVPVDGDTYDIPKIIMTAELRQALYGGKMFTFGHRQKFGNDPEKHVDFSAVTHVAKDRGIPPFLILYFAGNPETTSQARRLEAVLEQAAVPARAYGKRDSNHSRLNNDLGKPDDPATQELYRFLEAQVGGQ